MTKCILSVRAYCLIIVITTGLFLVSMLNPLYALQPSSNLGTLQVVSIRKIADHDPNAKNSDYIGASTRVRLRFEAPKATNVYLYAPAECPPEGYVLERKGGHTIWLASLRKADPSASPGFADLKSQLGVGWIFLPAGAAIEWDIDTEPTPAGVQRARSVFVAKQRDSIGTEVLSDWFATSPSDAKTAVPQH
jgi:hypothetical protein